MAELSRISRSIKDFSEIWEMMQRHKCGFSSLRENFDTTTAAGEMVLFTVANIAQFERRQISERVSANFNARAERGLYNGGVIPLGYQRVEAKSGYLEVNEDEAKIVRAAFDAVIKQGSLLPAARWLNENGYRIRTTKAGGGPKKRLGFFTVGNLQVVVRNKFYLGVRVFRHKGKVKETQAVWPAIIDDQTFEKVGATLDQNFRKKKDKLISRYPYSLSGLVVCKSCGQRMVGKSAHGQREKIGYYEHSWQTIKGSAQKSHRPKCAPYRVLAKQLEPAVMNDVKAILSSPKVAQQLLASAKTQYRLNPHGRELEKYNQIRFSTETQLELLAERLASLPKSVSPAPIFNQMEKLEAQKKAAEAKLGELKAGNTELDEPASLQDYERFLSGLTPLLSDETSLPQRMRLLKRLIHRIEITPEGAQVFFRVGETYVDGILEETRIMNKKRPEGDTFGPADSEKNEGVVCSTIDKNGSERGT